MKKKKKKEAKKHRHGVHIAALEQMELSDFAAVTQPLCASVSSPLK